MIRPLCAEDLNTVISIWYSASVKAHDFISEEFWRSQKTSMRDLYLPNCKTWVYENDHAILGFVSYYQGDIPAIFVTPSAQSQGVGTQLLNFLKGKYSELSLTVYCQNQKNHQFYLYQGFTAVEENLCAHTGHPQIVMRWSTND